MKISQMLEREDFYRVNGETLNRYYGKSDCVTKLYIYPELNAIVTKRPSKRVMEYLLREYSVRGNTMKRFTVMAYVHLCLQSAGILSSKTIVVSAHVSNEILIYPCNKKYRIFNFEENTVDVITKEGFSDAEILHEIEFRGRKNLPGFVPGIVSANGTRYREEIIAGKPLARITVNSEKYRNMAYHLLCEYRSNQNVTISSEVYKKRLCSEIVGLISQKVRNVQLLCNLMTKLTSIEIDEYIELTFSHGDLQEGNIWVEDQTEKLYIIDWESWGTRSIWYDKAVLFNNLRPGGLKAYFLFEIPSSERTIVLLEDIIFQLRELNSLPGSCGEEQFEAYLSTLALKINGGDINAV